MCVSECDVSGCALHAAQYSCRLEGEHPARASWLTSKESEVSETMRRTERARAEPGISCGRWLPVSARTACRWPRTLRARGIPSKKHGRKPTKLICLLSNTSFALDTGLCALVRALTSTTRALAPRTPVPLHESIHRLAECNRPRAYCSHRRAEPSQTRDLRSHRRVQPSCTRGRCSHRHRIECSLTRAHCPTPPGMRTVITWAVPSAARTRRGALADLPSRHHPRLRHCHQQPLPSARSMRASTRRPRVHTASVPLRAWPISPLSSLACRASVRGRRRGRSSCLTL